MSIFDFQPSNIRDSRSDEVLEASKRQSVLASNGQTTAELPAPDITFAHGVATWITSTGPFRSSDPKVWGRLAAIFAEEGHKACANAFWDAELRVTEPMGDA